MHRCDPAALVVGPTGLAYDAEADVLYIASTGDNAIFAVTNAREAQQDAGMGTLVYSDQMHLHGPLALVLAVIDKRHGWTNLRHPASLEKKDCWTFRLDHVTIGSHGRLPWS